MGGGARGSLGRQEAGEGRRGWDLSADSLVGHLHHLLDGRVAGRQEVLSVLLHLDGFQPLGHRAEGHTL